MAPKLQPKAPHPSTFVDIVVSASSSLEFLEKWRPVIAGYHLIIIQTSSTAKLTVPAGLDAEIHTPADASKALGADAWCVCAGGALCISYGLLVSKKRFIYMIGEEVSLAKDPSGKVIDPLAQHLVNLQSPATPFFFNTLYDPYREGADFVRGYPFSLREGIPCTVSHGLWLNRPDYDTATSMVKPLERNTRYVDATLTVPKNVLYSMSNLNLAFDRELIGPAMFTGLNWNTDASVDDMWAGWCAKVVSDHLGHGHKTGLPYVWREEKAAGSSAVGNIQKDSKSMLWQEELVPFFSQVKLSAASTTPEQAYLELAAKVLETFGNKDECFVKLAGAMVCWVKCWNAMKA